MPFLHVNDIKLYYNVTGRGEPLVFIHGLGSSGRDWQPQIDFFSRSYQVIVFDVRGHGQSDHPGGPYTISLFAADTAKLIEALHIQPVHLIGLSLGGMIAFQLAIDRMDLLKSIVIVNAGPEVRLRSPRQWLMVLHRYLIVRFRGMHRMGEYLACKLFPGEDLATFRQVFIERMAENDRKAYLQSMKSFVGWSVSDRISRINIPTLVIASDHDYTPVSSKEAFVARMPRAELMVIDNAHHAVSAERPDIFNTLLEAFLQCR